MRSQFDQIFSLGQLIEAKDPKAGAATSKIIREFEKKMNTPEGSIKLLEWIDTLDKDSEKPFKMLAFINTPGFEDYKEELLTEASKAMLENIDIEQSHASYQRNCAIIESCLKPVILAYKDAKKAEKYQVVVKLVGLMLDEAVNRRS